MLEDLSADADPGLVASAMYNSSPAAAVTEEVVAGWALELLGLPATAAVGFVTGARMANFSCLAAARGALLRDLGWNAEEQGLFGAPPIQVLVGAEVHVTVLRALRFLGLGQSRVTEVPIDANGAMDPKALGEALRSTDRPPLVCAQAGNVNTGACDPLAPIAEAAAEHGAWLHVDGAFGLWAAASPRFEPLVAGRERAQSWAVDAHKWLNTPYDCALCDRQPARRSVGRHGTHRGLPGPDRAARAGAVRARGLSAGAGDPSLRRLAHAGPPGRGRTRRALL